MKLMFSVHLRRLKGPGPTEKKTASRAKGHRVCILCHSCPLNHDHPHSDHEALADHFFSALSFWVLESPGLILGAPWCWCGRRRPKIAP